MTKEAPSARENAGGDFYSTEQTSLFIGIYIPQNLAALSWSI